MNKGRTMEKLNRYIDHTLLKPEATKSQIENLCQEALKFNFFSVCVNPHYVSLCANILKGSEVSVCTVIGFPLGSNTTESKVFETKDAINKGAQEIDMVINIAAIKSGDWNLVEEDIRQVKKACGTTLLKVIFETCLLNNEEKVMACKVSQNAGADFVKTSTGFSTGGATVDDVKLMRSSVANHIGVKASGGVRDFETAKKMVELGATRLGTSSGIAIMTGATSTSSY